MLWLYEWLYFVVTLRLWHIVTAPGKIKFNFFFIWNPQHIHITTSFQPSNWYLSVPTHQTRLEHPRRYISVYGHAMWLHWATQFLSRSRIRCECSFSHQSPWPPGDPVHQTYFHYVDQSKLHWTSLPQILTSAHSWQQHELVSTSITSECRNAN